MSPLPLALVRVRWNQVRQCITVITQHTGQSTCDYCTPTFPLYFSICAKSRAKSNYLQPLPTANQRDDRQINLISWNGIITRIWVSRSNGAYLFHMLSIALSIFVSIILHILFLSCKVVYIMFIKNHFGIPCWKLIENWFTPQWKICQDLRKAQSLLEYLQLK